MNRLFAVALASVCAGIACSVNDLKGPCNSNSDCSGGAVCEQGRCVSRQCRPACTSAQVCDTDTVTCGEAKTPSITVNSPGANSFAGLSLQASATARAPGGVSGLNFEVRSTGGAVLATAPGTPTSPGSADFTATIPLNAASIAEGPAVLVTSITYQTTQTFAAPPVTFQIDKTPPSISMGTYDGSTAPFVGPGNATAVVTAQVTDTGAGVDPAEVKLTLLGGDNGTFVGTPGTGGVYTFSVPRTSLSTVDTFVGSIAFKIDAKDLVKNAAASLTGLPTQIIRIDNAKPSLMIVADTTWYAATAGSVTVSATISDGAAESGLITSGTTRPFLRIGQGSPVLGTQGTGNTWTFSFDPSAQTANTEGPVSFTITAQDVAGNVQVASDSRNVDNKPPQLTGLEVFLDGSADPGVAGVTYPNVANTGRDGQHFIYNDSLHIKGSLTDSGAKLAGTSLFYRIDGLSAAGAPVLGTPQTLTGAGCVDASTSCAIDIAAVAPADQTKHGRFDQGQGNLTLVILAEDAAVAANGTTAAHNVIAANALSVAITRLWWKRTFPAATVSGMAIHPNGDVIVSTATAASQDSLFGLFRDGPFHAGGNAVHWSKGKDFYGVGLDLGSIAGAPVVGGGATTTERIYVATATPSTTRGGDLVSVDASGNLQWTCRSSGGTAPIVGTPAVSGGSKLNGAFCEGVFAGSASNTSLNGACQNPTTSDCTSDRATLTDAVTDSPVTVLGQKFYVGTSQHVTQVPLLANLTGFGTPSNFPTVASGAFSGIAISGTNLFAGSSSGTVYAFASSNLAQVFATPLPASIQGEPVVDPIAGSGLVLSTTDSKLHGLDISAATPVGTDRLLASFLSVGHTPLLAADNRIYVGVNQAVLSIDDTPGYPVIWSLSLGVNATAAPNMDCSGILYIGGGDTAFAVITDKAVLPNTGGLRSGSDWPKFQRDSRNSGNGDATTMWGVRVSNTVGGCSQ